jgi:MYXO-CTERM domain-containing protein
MDVNEGEWQMSAYGDMAQVMLHEIGHTLGLSHSNNTKMSCESTGKIHGGPIMGANGVMQSTVPANFAAFRSWRRDDLEGLNYLYGSATDAFEIAWWDDATYPDYPSESLAQSLVGMEVSRSVAISNRTSSPFQALATVAPDGRVIHRLMDESGNLTPSLADAVVDPGPSGVTWAMPAIALGAQGSDDRIFVAWMADEMSDSNQVTLRVATRSIADMDWSFANHPDEFRVNRLSAGFLPEAEALVVSTMLPSTTEIRLALFDADGIPVGSTLTLAGLFAFDVGAPLCEGTRCLMPFSESAFGGPGFGVVEIQIDPRTFAASVSSMEIRDELLTFGRLTLLEDTQELLGGTGERRFFLGNYPGLQPAPAAFMMNPDSDWPLGIGMWNDGQRRLFQPRAVVCGNGIIQAGESCDDANSLAGDGCDACVIEPGADSDVGDDEIGDATGDFPGEGDDGCSCRARGSGGGALGLGLLGLLFGVRRRRQL